MKAASCLRLCQKLTLYNQTSLLFFPRTSVGHTSSSSLLLSSCSSSSSHFSGCQRHGERPLTRLQPISTSTQLEGWWTWIWIWTWAMAWKWTQTNTALKWTTWEMIAWTEEVQRSRETWNWAWEKLGKGAWHQTFIHYVYWDFFFHIDCGAKAV